MEGTRISCLYALGCDRLREIKKEEIFLKFLEDSETNLNEIKKTLTLLDSFPFYQLIARQNDIFDFFDEKVVRAYWLGNDFLKTIKRTDLLNFLKERKDFPVFILKKFFDLVGGLPHHNFEVLWMIKSFRRVSDIPVELLTEINNCLIRGGKIYDIVKKDLLVKVNTFKVVFKRNSFSLEESKETIDGRLIKDLNCSDFISIHFGKAREKIESQVAENILKITKSAIIFFEG